MNHIEPKIWHFSLGVLESRNVWHIYTYTYIYIYTHWGTRSRVPWGGTYSSPMALNEVTQLNRHPTPSGPVDVDELQRAHKDNLVVTMASAT